MAEIAISVAAKIAEYLVVLIARPFSYLWNYKTNFKNLKNEVEKLEESRDTLQLLVTDARRNDEEIFNQVERWLDRAKNIIDEASELNNEDNHQQADMQCFKGFSCTNLKKRYQHSKKAAKLNAVVGVVQEEAGKFREVAHRTIPEQIPLQPNKEYQAFESRMSILKEIIDALSNSDFNMIGIYGMGGVGKSTLAKEVAREASFIKQMVAIEAEQSLSLFDKIIFVEVSRSSTIREIQGMIADNLGLHFSEESIAGRANRLRHRMKKEENILLILDNIWGSIDFKEVGIPFENGSKGLKLVVTTRRSDVLSLLTNEMDSQRTFHIEVLNEEDAWILFKSTAGKCTEKPELKPIAVEVAKKCGGMPVAIVTIAKALRNKQEPDWKSALRELRNPSKKSFEGIAKEVYTCIKFSYDSLENEELKKTFLLCSRMGCTVDASIQDLFIYGFGLGFYEDFNTVEEALCNIHASVNKLKATSLLFDAPESEGFVGLDPHYSERFAMHDVICDVARSIASNQNVETVIDDSIPRSWENESTLRGCTSITLHNISELPKDLELVCPHLKFLYVKPKDSFSEIPDNFFAEMPMLQVLHLVGIDLRPLPISLSCLVELRTLCLDGCKLGDIADIGRLKKLGILSFRGSQIHKLSEQIRYLTKLRLLDLSGCTELRVIPPKVMSCLTKLEALYMGKASIQWESERPDIERSNANIDELQHLCDLSILEIHVPDVEMSKGLLSPKLERFKILIGDKSKWRDWEFHSNTSRLLKLKLESNEDGVISQLKGIRELELREVPGARNLVDDLDRNGFTELKSLYVRKSPHCLCIVDSKRDALPYLESLILSKLKGLEKICNGPLGEQSFRQLRSINVRYCDKLNNIFSFSTDRILPQLEEIEVGLCSNMEEIFAIGGQDEANNNEVVHEIKFSQLRILKLKDLPQLKSMCCKVKTASPLQLTRDTEAREIISEEELDIPTQLFNQKVMFPNLETLEISNLNVEKIWDNQLPTMSCVQNLTHLVVFGCGHLKELFSSSMVNSFAQLQDLRISHCHLLQEMVVTEEIREERRITLSFRRLNSLYISDLGNLRTFCSGNYIEFPSLKEMTIYSCPGWKEFIFDDKVGFPSLETMKIFCMDNLKMIWHNNLAVDSFCKLKSLEVRFCEELLTVFPSNVCGRLLSLESLNVFACNSLEEIFDLRELNCEVKQSIAANQLREYDPQIMLSFANLQEMEVSACRNLKNIFSASTIVKEVIARFLFPKLTSLRLDVLLELRTFYPGRHTLEGPVPKELVLQNCRIHSGEEEGQIQKPLFSPEEVVFPRLQTLYVAEILVIRNLFPMMSSGVQNLTKLIVDRCDNLKGLFSSSMVVTEEIQEKERRNTISFPNLNYLKMKRLAKLTRLCSGYYIEFPSLKKIKIYNCPGVEAFLFDDKVGVPSLEEMTITSMENLKMIWHNQLDADSFCKLKLLKVNRCQKLVTVLPWNMFGRLLSLESLNVGACDSLEEIFHLQGIHSERRDSTAATQSRELGIYDPQIIPSLANLQKLEVVQCLSLKNIFPESVIGELSKLECLRVYDCRVKEIVAKERLVVDEAPARFHFSKLTSLELENLPELRTFYPGRYTVEGPILKELELHDCSIHDTDEEDQMQKAPFLVEEAFPCLEELDLAGKNIEMIWQGQVSEFLFDRLKILKVKNDESTILPLGIILRFHNLEMLSLRDSSYQELFSYAEVQGTLAKMKELVLSDLNDLQYMWKHDPQLDLILQNLEVLKVWSCESLINLLPPFAFFQNLTVLRVSGCSSLINMVTFLTARSLVHLTEMSIYNCSKLTEVVENQGDVTKDKIIFSNLKRLSLQFLPSLTSFCSWNFTLELPSLETLDVLGCQNMKSLSQGDLTMHTLKKVKIGVKSVKIYPGIDLNKAMQQLHEEENSESS